MIFSWIKLQLLIVFICVNINPTFHLTIASQIYSEIIPISINDEKVILAKTRLIENYLGTHGEVTVKYGFCLIENKSITEFKGITLKSPANESINEYYKNLEFWDAIFYGETTNTQLKEITSYLKLDNSFDSVNVKPYLKNKKLKKNKFEEEYDLNLADNPQLSLKNGQSEDHVQTKDILVQYDFGDVLILYNESDIDEGYTIGASFNYYNPWTDADGKGMDIGFGVFKITGILFK